MEINIKTVEDIEVVVIEGDIDASTAPTITEKVTPLVKTGSKIILDMTKVGYMSSAGVRTLLTLYRQADTKKGNLVLVGLSEDVEDTMNVTGFLKHFKTTQDLEAGLAAFN